MEFRFIYVDDEDSELQRIVDAALEYNEENPPVRLVCQAARDPDALRHLLKEDVDLVLTDVYWGDPGTNRLKEIIDIVKLASAQLGLSSGIPIVAFTCRGPAALRGCLEHQRDLFDIWDKGTASPAYVTWRLSQLAAELSRVRPDTLIQRLIRAMNQGARWHNHVVDMSVVYQKGLTERDQIERAGGAIGRIADDLRAWERVAEPLWKVMSRWEALSRAVSFAARGHARHVINVFWLGYLLIHNDLLRPWFVRVWTALLEKRKRAAQAAVDNDSADSEAKSRLAWITSALSQEPIETLSDSWFYASLFHDSAGCVQKYEAVRDVADALLSEFSELITSLPPPASPSWDSLKAPAGRLFKLCNRSLASLLEPLWAKSVEKGAPDHGVVAALRLKNSVTAPAQIWLAHEAALAMASHNLVGELGAETGELCTWESEPLVCLLMICDQIQTWDRERADSTLQGPDGPDRAQLAEFAVRMEDARPHIAMTIDYIAPRHVFRSAELFDRVQDALENTLRDKPSRALHHIGGEWPFHVTVGCKLSGFSLKASMRFGA
jgi:hypothetical protein